MEKPECGSIDGYVVLRRAKGEGVANYSFGSLIQKIERLSPAPSYPLGNYRSRFANFVSRASRLKEGEWTLIFLARNGHFRCLPSACQDTRAENIVGGQFGRSSRANKSTLSRVRSVNLEIRENLRRLRISLNLSAIKRFARISFVSAKVRRGRGIKSVIPSYSWTCGRVR